MKRPLVVVTDYNFDDLSIEHDLISQRGFALETAQCRTEAQVVEVAREADGLLVQAAPITEAVLSQLRNCRVIARYGVGVDTIDVEAATRRGILVANVRNYCTDEVADHAITLLLALARRAVALDQEVKSGSWDVHRSGKPIRRLSGQTLGIVGFGTIGRAVAARAMAFGLGLLAFDPWIPAEAVASSGASAVGLEQLLQESDFVSLHSPLAGDSRYLIDDPQLALMKPTALLINTARGGLIREDALVRALEEKRLAGAGLDVLEKEPPDPSNPLLKMGNVIVTPHAAYYSQESSRELHTMTVMAVIDALSGRNPESVANPQVLANLPWLR